MLVAVHIIVVPRSEEYGDARPFEIANVSMTNLSSLDNVQQQTMVLRMLNRSLCEIVETSDEVSGLFNFSWDSETSLSFVTPCALWAEDQYLTVSVELEDGRTSSANADVAAGFLDAKRQARSDLYYTNKCVENGTMLLNGGCRRCPRGATCPGGGRVWPERGYFNFGEFSGFVQSCGLTMLATVHLIVAGSSSLVLSPPKSAISYDILVITC